MSARSALEACRQELDQMKVLIDNMEHEIDLLGAEGANVTGEAPEEPTTESDEEPTTEEAQAAEHSASSRSRKTE